MDHKLRVTVRVDVGSTSVCLDVGGCLTADSCASLFPAFREEPLDGGELTIIAPDILPDCLAPDDCPCDPEPVAA